MSKKTINIEERRERIRRLKSQEPMNGTPSSPSSPTSQQQSSESSENSQTTEQHEPWRPQSDNMVVASEQVPAFMVEVSKLFQMAINSEIGVLGAVVAQEIQDNPEDPVPEDLENQLSILTLARMVSRQMQVKYAAMIQASHPQLWTPDQGIIPVTRGSGDG